MTNEQEAGKWGGIGGGVTGAIGVILSIMWLSKAPTERAKCRLLCMYITLAVLLSISFYFLGKSYEVKAAKQVVATDGTVTEDTSGRSLAHGFYIAATCAMFGAFFFAIMSLFLINQNTLATEPIIVEQS